MPAESGLNAMNVSVVAVGSRAHAFISSVANKSPVQYSPHTLALSCQSRELKMLLSPTSAALTTMYA